MNDRNNGVTVYQHDCDEGSIVLYNTTLLNNDKTEIWVQSLTTTKAPSMNELKA
jgi:hypothetical protein